MARLRVRIELNRRIAGVPLDKMASVVEETRKFFYLLSEDVHIQADRGEWLATDFDPESLNFTAEYFGPVSAEQAQAFGAAFAGATSLRKTTIAQFTRIAEFLGEDELVGFGLYKSDQEAEPTEWRCLSKRDAMRFGEEIKLLAQAAGEPSPETQLPAVMNGSVAGRRLFKDRREREALAADPSKLIREMESNLSRRIGLLEDQVAEQTRRIQQIHRDPELAEERFQKLLSAMETFWAQAPRPFAQLPAPPAVEHQTAAEQTAPIPEASAAAVSSTVSQPAPAPAIEAPRAIAAVAAAEAQAPSQMPVALELQPGVTKPGVTTNSDLATLDVTKLDISKPNVTKSDVTKPDVTKPAPEATLDNVSAQETASSPAQTLAQPAAGRTVVSRKRRWSLLGLSAAAMVALVTCLAFPKIQYQWERLASTEPLPIMKLKPPAAPVLPAIPAPEKTVAPQEPIEQTQARPVAKTVPVAARSSEPFIGPLIPLEVPAKVKSKIQSEVRVDVLVAIDQEGKVTGAEVSSTKGQSAHLLEREALRAAKQSRFRPAREGDKTVASQMILTFLFKPDSNEF